MTTKLADCNVRVESLGLTITAIFETKYHDGNRAIMADFKYDDGGRAQNALSVNLPDQQNRLTSKDQFFLKTWSERVEVSAALLASGLIVDTGMTAQCGFVSAPIVNLHLPE